MKIIMAMVINFVMSSDIKSQIFEDLINIYRNYLDNKYYSILVSKDFLENVDLYILMRPHLVKLNEIKGKENKIIIYCHNDFINDSWIFNIANYKDIFIYSKGFICLNSIQKEYIEKYFKNKKILLLPHAVNNNFYPLENKEIKEKINLGFCSRRYPRLVKGEDLLIKIAKNIPIKKFKFTLIGKDRHIERDILKKIGFEVDCFTNLEYSKYPEKFRNFDLYLILSHCEGGPASLLEALKSAIPVLSTKVGMCVDFIKHNRNGFLINNYLEAIEILNKIDKKHLITMHNYIKKVMKINYNWKDAINKFENFIIKEFFKNE